MCSRNHFFSGTANAENARGQNTPTTSHRSNLRCRTSPEVGRPWFGYISNACLTGALGVASHPANAPGFRLPPSPTRTAWSLQVGSVVRPGAVTAIGSETDT